MVGPIALVKLVASAAVHPRAGSRKHLPASGTAGSGIVGLTKEEARSAALAMAKRSNLAVGAHRHGDRRIASVRATMPWPADTPTTMLALPSAVDTSATTSDPSCLPIASAGPFRLHAASRTPFTSPSSTAPSPVASLAGRRRFH